MKLTTGCFLQRLCFSEVSRLLPVRNAVALAEHVQLLDVHRKNDLNSKYFSKRDIGINALKLQALCDVLKRDTENATSLRI